MTCQRVLLVCMYVCLRNWRRKWIKSEDSFSLSLIFTTNVYFATRGFFCAHNFLSTLLYFLSLSHLPKIWNSHKCIVMIQYRYAKGKVVCIYGWSENMKNIIIKEGREKRYTHQKLGRKMRHVKNWKVSVTGTKSKPHTESHTVSFQKWFCGQFEKREVKLGEEKKDKYLSRSQRDHLSQMLSFWCRQVALLFEPTFQFVHLVK